MNKVIVRRNFGSGGALSSFAHRRHKAKKITTVTDENIALEEISKRGASRAVPETVLERQADRLSYLAYVAEVVGVDFSEWEIDFLESIEKRIVGGLGITAKQEVVLDRLINASAQGKSLRSAYEKEKKSKGALYVPYI